MRVYVCVRTLLGVCVLCFLTCECVLFVCVCVCVRVCSCACVLVCMCVCVQNHEDVWVVVDPSDYPSLLASLPPSTDSSPSPSPSHLRRRLAWKAFQHVASYDAMVAEWMWGRLQAGEGKRERGRESERTSA